MGVARYVGVFRRVGRPRSRLRCRFLCRQKSRVYQVRGDPAVDRRDRAASSKCRTSGAARGAAAAAVVGSAPVPDQVFRRRAGIPKSRPRSRRRSRVCPSCAGRISCRRRTSGSWSSRRISECCSRTSTTRCASSRRNGASRSGISTRTSSPWRCAASLLPRLAIIGVKPRQQDPVWRFVGHGHGWMGRGIRPQGDRREGREYSRQGLRRMGQQLLPIGSRIGAAALRPGQHVDAVPQRARQAVAAGPLREVLLPWKTPSEEIFVTLCSRTVGGGAAAESRRPPGTTTPADSSESRKFAMSS